MKITLILYILIYLWNFLTYLTTTKYKSWKENSTHVNPSINSDFY